MEDVAGAVASRHADRDADADRAADHVAAQRHPIAQCGAQLLAGLFCCFDRHRSIRHDDELVAAEPRSHTFGAGFQPQLLGECPDEPVAGGVAEVVVDRLQSIEVEVQHRDGTGLTCGESFGEVRDQRATVVQTGQIVVLGEVAKLFFGLDTGLELRKQGCDGLDGVELVGPPLLATKFHAGQLAGGDAPGDQWRRGCRRRGDLGGVVSPTVPACRRSIARRRDPTVPAESPSISYRARTTPELGRRC